MGENFDEELFIKFSESENGGEVKKWI